MYMVYRSLTVGRTVSVNRFLAFQSDTKTQLIYTAHNAHSREYWILFRGRKLREYIRAPGQLRQYTTIVTGKTRFDSLQGLGFLFATTYKIVLKFIQFPIQQTAGTSLHGESRGEANLATPLQFVPR